MKIKSLSAAIATAFVLSTVSVNAAESSSLDVGRLAIAGYGDVSLISQDGLTDEEGNAIQNNV